MADRGGPRKFVAAKSGVWASELKEIEKWAVFGRFADRRRRGTAGAIGQFMMNFATNDPAIRDAQETTASAWVNQHGDYLYNFAMGQVRDTSVAEDLVQDTFLAAIKGQERFAGRCSERTWLTGILRHKIYDHLRQVCRERAVRSDLPGLCEEDQAWDESILWMHEMADECHTASRRMELAEFRDNLEQALGKLPPRIAQVFQMYEIEERPNREVCQELNISENNLWVMLHRARKQLREHLGEWWSGESASAARTLSM
jgi:RNA polymerase sigma-70 factor, ECF subfamily